MKPPAEVARLFGTLFPGEPGGAIVAAIDAPLGHLPGLEGNALLRGAWRAA